MPMMGMVDALARAARARLLGCRSALARYPVVEQEEEYGDCAEEGDGQESPHERAPCL